MFPWRKLRNTPDKCTTARYGTGSRIGSSATVFPLAMEAVKPGRSMPLIPSNSPIFRLMFVVFSSHLVGADFKLSQLGLE